MQRTKPILKLLENAKLAFSLIDFTAGHSNHNHCSQTLRGILSGYRWFDLSSKITKPSAESSRGFWINNIFYAYVDFFMKRAAWASLPPSSRLSLEPSVDLRDNELNELQSQSFSASPAVSVRPEPIRSPSSRWWVTSSCTKYPVPAVNAEFSNLLPG